MRQPRRNPSPAFKAKVALEAAKGERTLAEIAAKYDLRATQVSAWKKQLLDGAVDAFESRADKPLDHDATVKELQARIHELKLERDFLSAVLKH